MTEWLEIVVKMDREQMFEFGPSIPVTMRIEDGTAEVEALAQVDTGGSISAISSSLYKRLRPSVKDRRNVRQAYLKPVSVPIVSAIMRFPEGAEVKMDYAVLPSMGDPHDVLIGREFLRASTLHINGIDGEFHLNLTLPLLKPHD